MADPMPGDRDLPEPPGSVTIWLSDLKAGDAAAAQPLWDRFFGRLVQLARQKLRGRQGPEMDEEDAALSAFDSFCTGVSQGKFPQLSDRDDLWRLLVVITARKADMQLRRKLRKKRGSGRVRGETDLNAYSQSAHDPTGGLRLDHIADQGPSPAFTAMVLDEYETLMSRLEDKTLQKIAVMRMEGYTRQEIAGAIACSVRSIANKIDLIKRIWNAALDAESDSDSGSESDSAAEIEPGANPTDGRASPSSSGLRRKGGGGSV